MAANAGALSQEAPEMPKAWASRQAALASELNSLEVTQKEAVQEKFPQEHISRAV